MKRVIVFTLLPLIALLLMGHPARTSPIYPYDVYGGSILFKNTSLYNQYWEIELPDNIQGGFQFEQICLEVNDIIKIDHHFRVHWDDASKFDKNIINPNTHFETISVYDMDTGVLIKEFTSGDNIFKLISGTIENGALWEINITDSNIPGENQ